MVAPKTSPITMPFGQGPPFRPLASARVGKRPAVVQDDRRTFAGELPGETFANEVRVAPTGAWTDLFLAPPAGLTECIRLTLPRPEPLIVSFHPWQDTDDRFRRASRLAAEVIAPGAPLVPDPLEEQGRIIVEWGSGKARNYTWVDCAPGSLQIPTASQVRISAWTHTLPVRLACTVEVGYTAAPLNATWTGMLVDDAIVAGVGMNFPHYAREFTGFMYGDDLGDSGLVRFVDETLTFVHNFQLRSAITPNPQAIPYAPVSVPIPGHVIGVNMSLTPFALTRTTVGGVVTVRI